MGKRDSIACPIKGDGGVGGHACPIKGDGGEGGHACPIKEVGQRVVMPVQ